MISHSCTFGFNGWDSQPHTTAGARILELTFDCAEPLLLVKRLGICRIRKSSVPRDRVFQESC